MKINYFNNKFVFTIYCTYICPILIIKTNRNETRIKKQSII